MKELTEKDIVRLWHQAVSECKSGAYIDMLALFATLVILEATSIKEEKELES